jgi:hypothetical protein
VIRFFSQVLKFPVAAVAAGFEIAARIVRDVQQTFDRSVDAFAAGVAQSLVDPDTDTPTKAADVDQVGSQNGIDNSGPAALTEGGNMEDCDGRNQDLSGDDLKVVRYRIIFTKRDYETDLQPDREETINYPTNGGSYGGLKVAEFMKRVADKDVPRPDVWKQNCYPENADPKNDKNWEFPADDLRYVTFLYEVIRRVEREEKEYDKEQVRILRGIQERL